MSETWPEAWSFRDDGAGAAAEDSDNDMLSETTQLLSKPPAVRISSSPDDLPDLPQSSAESAKNTILGMVAVAVGTALICTGGSLVV